MATPRKLHGYIYRQELARARAANTEARAYTARILDERPGPALAALYVAHIGIALGNISDALNQLATIIDTCEETNS